ncbi:MAG TPA: tyrosine-type recombinase/integrase [Acidimicrobiales bacterium]|nr:tyrosine-type recombinase/integrase [Acidimicrobiales bacterium]
MAHLQKRGNKWQARYRGPDGKEHAKRFDTKRDAERWLTENENERNHGTWIDPSHGRVLFEEWAATWWETTPALRPSSRARDLSYLRTHILPVFGPIPLAAIDHMMVTKWVAQLSAAGKAPATVQKANQILAKVMASAVDAKRIPASPCVKVKLPKIEREEMRFLDPDEIAVLASAIDPRYRALVLLGCYSGLRIGELSGLKRSRVHPLKRSVEVAEILTDVGGHLHWGQPKTRAGRRSVSVPAEIMDELTAHMERYSGQELVFTGPDGAPLRVTNWRRRHWNPAVAAAGLSPLRPHDMRHTAVALWIAAGVPPLQVTRRAGHTTTSFTQDRYGHLFPSAEDEAADALSRFVVAPKVDADVVQITKGDVG